MTHRPSSRLPLCYVDRSRSRGDGVPLLLMQHHDAKRAPTAHDAQATPLSVGPPSRTNERTHLHALPAPELDHTPFLEPEMLALLLRLSPRRRRHGAGHRRAVPVPSPVASPASSRGVRGSRRCNDKARRPCHERVAEGEERHARPEEDNVSGDHICVGTRDSQFPRRPLHVRQDKGKERAGALCWERQCTAIPLW